MFEAGIATRWSGTYVYGDPMIEPDPVDFEMHLTLRSLGRFTGEIIDGDGGIPEPAAIVGRVVGKGIQFRKQYRSLWIVDESGDCIVLPGQPPHVVRYEGELNDMRNAIVGTWIVRSTTFMIGGQSYRPSVSRGTWHAHSR